MSHLSTENLHVTFVPRGCDAFGQQPKLSPLANADFRQTLLPCKRTKRKVKKKQGIGPSKRSRFAMTCRNFYALIGRMHVKTKCSGRAYSSYSSPHDQLQPMTR